MTDPMIEKLEAFCNVLHKDAFQCQSEGVTRKLELEIEKELRAILSEAKPKEAQK